jgi:hypothetical protein
MQKNKTPIYKRKVWLQTRIILKTKLNKKYSKKDYRNLKNYK